MMSCFIKRKKEKIKHVFTVLGDTHTETEFVKIFKRLYPDDWQRIQDKWNSEEQNTPPGKKHPMQHPDVYMKEMYRNHKPKVKKTFK